MSERVSSPDEELARLRYRCRRGMLELDALLERFVQSPQFSVLNTAQRIVLDQLLDESDPQLLGWFMGREICQEAALKELIDLILRC